MQILIKGLSDKYSHVYDFRSLLSQEDLFDKIDSCIYKNLRSSNAPNFLAFLIEKRVVTQSHIASCRGTFYESTIRHPKLRNLSIRGYYVRIAFSDFPVFLITVRNFECNCGDLADYVFVSPEKIKFLCKAHSRISLLENELSR